MAKKITIPYGNKTYTLEFTRKTASALERNGFVIGEIGEKPVTMIPMLFRGAFLANHSTVKNETVDKIYEGLRNRTALVEVLVEMYYDAYATLLDGDEDADEGNPGWAVAE